MSQKSGRAHSSTYTASPGDLRCTGLAVDRDRLHPRQFLHCHPLAHSTPWRYPPVHRRGHISHFIISTAYQLQGAAVITPLAYLTISITSSVRGAGTKHQTAPLTHHQAESVLVSILLGFVLPSVLVVSHSARAGTPSGSLSRSGLARRRHSTPSPPLAALVIAVQQGCVWISSLQIHPVRALHGGSDGFTPTAFQLPSAWASPPHSLPTTEAFARCSSATLRCATRRRPSAYCGSLTSRGRRRRVSMGE